jgi:hypothetical protein
MPRMNTEFCHGNARNDTECLPRINTEWHGRGATDKQGLERKISHGMIRKGSVFFGVIQWRMIWQLFYATDEHGMARKGSVLFSGG